MTHNGPDDRRDDPGFPLDELDPALRHRLTGLMGSMTDDDRGLLDPPDSVWAGISAAAAADDGLRPVHERNLNPTVIPTADPTVNPAAGPTVDPAPSGVVLRPSVWQRRSFLAAAAAIVVVAGIGLGVVATRSPAPETLARAELEQLEPLGRTKASVRLVEEDGTTHLVIDASDMAPPPPGSKYELWLIDDEVTDPRSLGAVTGSDDVVVPPSIDPATHPIVDISLEPDDDDHQHSGHSLMRGTLA